MWRLRGQLLMKTERDVENVAGEAYKSRYMAALGKDRLSRTYPNPTNSLAPWTRIDVMRLLTSSGRSRN